MERPELEVNSAVADLCVDPASGDLRGVPPSTPAFRPDQGRTSYSISDPRRPWVVLFSSSSIDAVAEATVAQSEVASSLVYATLDGKPRSLTTSELVQLYERVLELTPDDPIAIGELETARRDLRDNGGPAWRSSLSRS